MDLRLFFIFFSHMKANGVKFVLLTKFKKKKSKNKKPYLKVDRKRRENEQGHHNNINI